MSLTSLSSMNTGENLVRQLVIVFTLKKNVKSVYSVCVVSLISLSSMNTGENPVRQVVILCTSSIRYTCKAMGDNVKSV